MRRVAFSEYLIKARIHTQTYSFWNEFAIEHITRRDPRRQLSARRVYPERLLDDGHEIRQPRRALKVDLGHRLKRAPHFGCHRLQHLWVLEQVIHGRIQGGGRRFAAGRDQDGRVEGQIDVREPRRAVARLLQHVRHEVAAPVGALAHGLAAEGLFGREVENLLHLGDFRRQGGPEAHQEFNQRVRRAQLAHCVAAEAGAHQLDPGVVVVAVERVE